MKRILTAGIAMAFCTVAVALAQLAQAPPKPGPETPLPPKVSLARVLGKRTCTRTEPRGAPATEAGLERHLLASGSLVALLLLGRAVLPRGQPVEAAGQLHAGRREELVRLAVGELAPVVGAPAHRRTGRVCSGDERHAVRDAHRADAGRDDPERSPADAERNARADRERNARADRERGSTGRAGGT